MFVEGVFIPPSIRCYYDTVVGDDFETVFIFNQHSFGKETSWIQRLPLH